MPRCVFVLQSVLHSALYATTHTETHITPELTCVCTGLVPVSLLPSPAGMAPTNGFSVTRGLSGSCVGGRGWGSVSVCVVMTGGSQYLNVCTHTHTHTHTHTCIHKQYRHARTHTYTVFCPSFVTRPHTRMCNPCGEGPRTDRH